jgi:hypothetical protein
VDLLQVTSGTIYLIQKSKKDPDLKLPAWNLDVDSQRTLSLIAFLSHKYKAPTVNEFFFQLFSQAADIQFEVDIGSTSTNVTRLERFIRDADAFIGIYPFDPVDTPNPSTADLLDASKYFRLELDLAARARKPGLILRDSRYRGVLSAPPPMCEVPFDIKEIVSRGSKPSSAGFTRAFRAFCSRVAAEREYQLEAELPELKSDAVGILVPLGTVADAYNREQVEIISQAIAGARYTPMPLEWPPIITPAWIAQIRALNWIVVDTGPATTATGIVGYLHGEFKPAMRLRRVASTDQISSYDSTGLALYDGFEVGYKKDIIRWCDSETLAKGLAQRITSLDAGRRRISTLEEALTYFRSAALRKEAVFISYAGSDEATARNIREAFKKKFQQVFDYRDGKSIRPGQPWLEEIFDQLALSAVGVPLLSSAYIESGNCMHELREMIARFDNRKMQIFPVKLKPGDQFKSPSELREC